jgi:DNA (cytosine-5)-methyltransferase 1
LFEYFGNADVRVLAGCAPCQPFSTYSNRYDTVGTERWGLLYEFDRLIKGTYPQIVAMENVPSVALHSVFLDFVSSLESAGFHVWREIVDCAEYGLPQRRKRMVLLASKFGPITLSKPRRRKLVTVESAIGNLAALNAGESSSQDPLHSCSRLSAINLARIKASKPGGTWRDWPDDLVAKCHRRDSGQTYPGVYGRMRWNEPAPTLTTQFFGFGNGRFGHPEQDRGLSLREGAILQGFPRDYSFVPDGESVQFKALGRMIGNAVPVTLGRLIGKAIKKHLQEHRVVGSRDLARN